MAILNSSLDRWIELITSAVGGPRPNKPKVLCLFPEFNLQGFPIKETAKEWIEKACIAIPGPEVARLQGLDKPDLSGPTVGVAGAGLITAVVGVVLLEPDTAAAVRKVPQLIEYALAGAVGGLSYVAAMTFDE